MLHEEFDDFWDEVIEYAEKAGLSVRYIEEEFLLDGELIKENINFKNQPK